jgi:hypothetical protein
MQPRGAGCGSRQNRDRVNQVGLEKAYAAARQAAIA